MIKKFNKAISGFALFCLLCAGVPSYTLNVSAATVKTPNEEVITEDVETDQPTTEAEDSKTSQFQIMAEDGDSSNDQQDATEPEQPVAPTGPSDRKPYMVTTKRCLGTYEERYTNYEMIEYQLLCYPTSKITGERYIAPVYYYIDANGKEVLYIINDKGEVDYDGPVEGKMEYGGGIWKSDTWVDYYFTFTEIKGYKGYTSYVNIDGSLKEIKEGDISLDTAIKLYLDYEDRKKNSNGVCATGNATFDAFINDPRYRPQVQTYHGQCGDYAAAFIEYCFPEKKYMSKEYTDMNEVRAGDTISEKNHVSVVLKRKGNMLYIADGGINLKNKDTPNRISTITARWKAYVIPETGKLSDSSYIYGEHHDILKSESEFGPCSTEIKSIKSAKKALTIKWKKAAYSKGLKASEFEVEGYQLKISTNKSFKNPKYKTVYGTSKTIKNLKAKKKYYIKVRAWNYDEAGEYKIYSKWSSVKSQKTK